jgi:hypothetical protein
MCIGSLEEKRELTVTDPTSQGKRSNPPRPSHKNLRSHTPNTLIDEGNSSKIEEPRSSTLPSESQRAEHRANGLSLPGRNAVGIELESKRHGPVYVGGWVTSIWCVEEEGERVREERGERRDGRGGREKIAATRFLGIANEPWIYGTYSLS